MNINYSEDIKFWLNDDERKIIDNLLERLQLEGAENIRVTSRTNDFSFEGKEVLIRLHHLKHFAHIYVCYYENGAVHREDGPASRDYGIYNNELILDFRAYYYKHKQCHFRLYKEDMAIVLHNNSIVLDEERLSKHIFLKKILFSNAVLDQYFWVQNIT